MSINSLTGSSALNKEQKENASFKEELIQAYILGKERGLKIFFDPIKGAKAIIYEMGRQTDLPFNDSGIPKELRFSLVRLIDYLKDTYVQFNGTRVLIHHRLRGGGHSRHSRTDFTRRVEPPPPPRSVHINYTAGFTITGLNRPDVAGGSFTSASGGVGQRHYSTTFETHLADVMPSVMINVPKSECNAKRIRDLEVLKGQNLLSISSKLREKDDLQSRISTTGLLTQEIKEKIERKDQELIDLERDRENEIRLQFQEKEFDMLHAELKEKGNEIRSLISFLELNKVYGFGIDVSSSILRSFTEKQSAFSELVTPEILPKSLLSKCVLSATDWVASIDQAKGKDVIACIGNTGAGKSTTVNHLMGIPITRIEGKMQVKDGHREIAKIGHEGSETLYTQVYQGGELTFADCGGLLDSDGFEREFKAMASLKVTLSQSAKMRIILCVQAELADRNSHRGVLFDKVLRTFFGQLLKDYRALPKATLLMLTHLPRFEDDHSETLVPYTRESALKKLSALRAIKSSDPELELYYDYLLRDEGRYVTICNPTESCASVISVLKEMEGFSPASTLNLPLSDGLKESLFQEMRSIGDRSNELYESRERLSREISRLRLLVSEKEQKKQALLTEKEEMKSGLEEKTQYLLGIESAVGRIFNELRQLEKAKEEKEQTIFRLRSGTVIYTSNGGPWHISGQ